MPGDKYGTTPESWKGVLKIDSMRRTVVLESQYRSHKRYENDLPLSALWRAVDPPAARYGVQGLGSGLRVRC